MIGEVGPELCRFGKVAALVQVSAEVLADWAETWQERTVILGAADPNPFPTMRLWSRRRA